MDRNVDSSVSIEATTERVLREANRINQKNDRMGEVSSEGWNQYLLGESEICDAWVREAPTGTSISPHRHPDHRRFVSVLSGTVEFTVGGDRILLSEQEGEDKSLFVPAGTVVSAEIISDVRSVHIFQPPIGPSPFPSR